MKIHSHKGVVGVSILGVLVIALIAAGWYRIEKVSDQLAVVNTQLAAFASSSSLFEANIGSLAEKLSAEEEKTSTLTEALAKNGESINAIEKRFGKVSNTVEELEKLTKADPKVLQKYSKVFFLNEHYEPARTAAIPKEYVLSTTRTELVNAQVLPFLEELLEDAKDDGIELLIASAFRSFDTQAALKTRYTVLYGAGTANQFSADQGYSEHQLGTTVDFTTPEIRDTTETFEKTAAFKWLQDNAHKYGFVLSYPKGNQYYIYEPWHWRFVGEDLARDLHDDGKYFYDLEQREIDKYLPEVFD